MRFPTLCTEGVFGVKFLRGVSSSGVVGVFAAMHPAFKLIRIVGFTSVCYASCAPTDGTFKVLRIVGFTSVCCCEHIIQYCYAHRAKLAKTNNQIAVQC